MEFEDILSRLPIGKKMIQRDMKVLTDAGLIRVKYSKKDKAYLHDRLCSPALNESIEGKVRLHLLRLRRLAALMDGLSTDRDSYYEEEGWKLMIYFSQGELAIRDMEEKDAQPITDAEIEQGWDAEIGKYLQRLKDQEAGKAISLVAEYSGRPVGYINVYPDSQWGAFAGKGWPEIVDFGVLEKYRNQGVGTALMDVAEAVAAKYADIVYLGVGLHSGYGSAQRMYVKRGYIPDGSGAWYRDKVCEAYGECRNDDDLVLYFSKNLKQRPCMDLWGLH